MNGHFSKQKRSNDKQQMPLITCGHFVRLFQLKNMKEPEIQFCLKITTIMVRPTKKTEYGYRAWSRKGEESRKGGQEIGQLVGM